MRVPTAVDDRPTSHSDSGPVARGRRFKAGLRDLHSRSRRLISEHRHKRKLRDREVSDQSRRGLDWTNFFMADVQIGFGSFLAFYLADLGWSKQNVGLADRKSTRLNSSHTVISYAVFCLKKKKNTHLTIILPKNKKKNIPKTSN